MKRLLPFPVFLLLAMPGLSPIGQISAQTAVREVLATAFDAPFLTDAELEGGYQTDSRGRVVAPGGPVRVWYRGIVSILREGEPVPARRLGPDLLEIDLPAGIHEIEVLRAGQAASSSDRVGVAEPAAATPEEFKARAAACRPGEELVVRDGVYRGWKVEFAGEGTGEKPIVIRPQTPGGVILQRDSRVVLRGRFAVLRGFRFEQCTTGPTVNVLGSDCRVTQCQFAQCGSPLSTFAHIVEVGMGSHRNRVDHCFFTGSKSMSLSQSIRAVEGVGLDNRFDHNEFRDIYRYWINGQENIQIGQNQRDPTGGARSKCVVEFNRFDHAWGDGEIISNKSSGNVIRHNVAAHCRRSAFTLRGGFDVRFEGNVMVNNADGLRVIGSRHTITNNLILDQTGWGIYLETGSREGSDYTVSEGSVIARNTIANCTMGAIGVMAVSEQRTRLPTGNVFADNLLAGHADALGDGTRLPGSVVRHNLFWLPGEPPPAPIGEGAVVADPQFRGEGKALRPAPDGPGNGFGAPVLHPGLPPIPPRPVLNPSLYAGQRLFVQDPKQPGEGWRGDGKAAGEALSIQDAAVTLQTALPQDFLLEWEYQPDKFESAASVTFSGYAISWGGVARDGKPSGILELRKKGAVVADGTDVLYPSQQFRHESSKDRNTLLDQESWYRFLLLRRGGRLHLLLANTKWRGDPVPVILWEDRDHSATGGGGELQLQQSGGGRWRRVVLSGCEYAGDVRPPVPVNFTATAHGSGRVSLRWDAVAAGTGFEVYRGEEAGFTPGEDNLLAAGVRGGYEDFQVGPDTSYFYRVRAVNPIGLPSEFAGAEVRTGLGGPIYRLIPARQARIEAPFRLVEARAGEPAHAWTLPGIDRAMEPGLAQGGAEFTFAVEQAGDFALWGWVRAPDGSHDSFHVSLDEAPVKPWSTDIHPTFAWVKIAGGAKLKAGEHRLRVRHREPGAALAAILVTDDGAFAPGTGKRL